MRSLITKGVLIASLVLGLQNAAHGPQIFRLTKPRELSRTHARPSASRRARPAVNSMPISGNLSNPCSAASRCNIPG